MHEGKFSLTSTRRAVLLLPSEEYRFYPIMPSLPCAFSGGFHVGLRKRSSVRGIPDVLIGKLQRVQNYAARLVVRCDRCDHITFGEAASEHTKFCY